MNDLVIASTNVHKVREIRALLSKMQGFEIYSLLDFPDYQQPEESGSTFEENAALKASHAAKALKKWVLADDSGLVVPALGAKGPGVLSARYAGMGASDKENRKKLLKEMAHLNGLERAAYFECCLVISSPTGWKKSLVGMVEGTISHSEKGKNGFGYDPLFVKHDYNQTFAELEEGIKNKISHRAKAMEKMLLFLESSHFSEMSL